MKNLFLTAALVFAMSASAATTNIVSTDFNTIEASQEKEYKKIETSAVPAPVLKEISTKYSGYAISEAHASDDGEYKLIVTKQDKKVTVYYNSAGEFVKEQA